MKLGLISPYKELSDIARNVAQDMGISIHIMEASLEKAISAVRQMEEKGVDAIICRGATCALISKTSDLPVVRCDSTVFDIISAIQEAKEYTNQIGIITYDPINYGLEILEKSFGIKIVQLTSYENEKENEEKVNLLKEMGINIVIGGIISVEYAKKIGMKGILFKTSQESISQAFKNAIEMAKVRKRQLMMTERFKQILDFSYEGIIVVDGESRITIFNPLAEKIFRVKASDVIGENIHKAIPSARLDKIIQKGEPELGQIQNIGTSVIITNRVPIKINSEILGAVITFQEVSKIQNWEQKIRRELYSQGLVARYSIDDYIGESDVVKNLLNKVRRFSEIDATLLITGESGTGKEIIAQSVHKLSRRKDGPFVAVNCTALPENLLESELFGYEEGAFTGAKKGGKIGLFELAHQGTIFLDEIGSISKNLQASLLRVLQEKEIRRVGSGKVIRVDIRVLAATNNHLLKAVENGGFRQDLYYRLCVLEINVPPLRERKRDIGPLIKYFVEKYKTPSKSVIIKQDFIELLKTYDWPGNIRELQNFAERLCLLYGDMPNSEVFIDYLNEKVYEDNSLKINNQNTMVIKKGSLKEMESEIIKKLYHEVGENTTLLAERLNISRVTAWNKMKRIKGVKK